MKKDIRKPGTMVYDPTTKLLGWVLQKNIDLSGTKLQDSYWDVEWSNGYRNCLPFYSLNRVINEYNKLQNGK